MTKSKGKSAAKKSASRKAKNYSNGDFIELSVRDQEALKEVYSLYKDAKKNPVYVVDPKHSKVVKIGKNKGTTVNLQNRGKAKPVVYVTEDDRPRNDGRKAVKSGAKRGLWPKRKD